MTDSASGKEGSQDSTFGEYVLLAKLGPAPTYLADDPLLKRTIVVRHLGGELGSPSGDCSDTLSRLRSASRVNHPSIATIHAIGTADGQAYVAFEYVEGSPAAESLNADSLGVREVLGLAIPLADALAEAHQQDVTHGHLGLDRIIITRGGLPKLIGLGLGGTPGQGVEAAKGADVRDFGALLASMLDRTPGRGRPQELMRLVAQIQADTMGDVLSMSEVARELRSIDTQMERARRLRTPMLLLVVSGAFIAVILAIVHVRPANEASRSVIAVVGFGEPAGRDDAAQLGSMLTRLVSSDLSAARGLDVVSDQRLQETAYRLEQERGVDATDLRSEIANALGADRVIVGRVRSDPTGVLASAELIEASTNSVLATVQARVASSNEAFDLAASLSRQLRAALQEPDLSDAERLALADQLTSSVDAYRAYVRGLDAILRADMPAAATALRLATKLDPAFAAAQFRLAMVLIWTGDLLEATKADERAVAFRERLPPDIQPVVDAIGPMLGKDDSRGALPALIKCLERDPDNHDVLYLLGEIYTHSATCSDASKAFEVYEHLLSMAPNLSIVYDHALSSLLQQGKPTQAEAWLDRWKAYSPTNMPQLRGTLALWAGRFDDASGLLADPLIPDFLSGREDAKSVMHVLNAGVADLTEELKDLSGPYLCLALDLRADILVAHGKFAEAEDLYRRASDIAGLIAADGFFTSLRNGARERCALLAQFLGRPDAAGELVRTALGQQPESYRCLYIDGLIALQQGDSERARKSLALLNDLVHLALGPAAALYRDALAAELAFADGRVAEARDGFAALLAGGHLWEGWYAHEDTIVPFVRDGLARAEVSLGHTDKALAAWAALSDAGLERLRVPIPWMLSFFQRGKLQISLGRTDEGRQLLSRFLDGWGSVDHPLPEVTEARALLAR